MDLFTDNGDINQKIRAKLAKLGWTCRARWMDNRPRRTALGMRAYDGKLIGFRFTNADALLERALSIQVFDRSTVSLSFDGFTNDDHLSFTDEDGRDILQYLRNLPGSPLTEEFWDELPEAERKELQPAAMTTGKGHLVAVLAQSHPHIFGRGGRISTEGTDFYEEVLSILDDHDRIPMRDVQLQSIQQLEGLAHDFYSAANASLRAAATPELDGTQRARHHATAFGFAKAADDCRTRADHIRSTTQNPPAPDTFPDQTPPIDILDILGFMVFGTRSSAQNAGVTSDTPEAMRQAIIDKNAGRNEWGKPTIQSDEMDSRLSNDYRPGDLVVVTDPGEARTQQIGQIKSTGPSTVEVQFTAGKPIAKDFLRSQIAPLDQIRARHLGPTPK
jgi:hypothetical protein